MSIFGIKKQKRSDNIETLIMHVRDLHKRVKPISDLEQRISEFQQNVHDNRNIMLNQINTQGDRYNQLQDRVRDLTINNRLLRNSIENMKNKKVITIFAESKGSLTNNKVFSFGNGGREIESGYVMNFQGQILGIALSSKRTNSDDVSVAVAVNGKIQPSYGINLNNLPRKFDNFGTPLIINVQDVINFVAINNNPGCENTVVSLIIELFF